jgi:hypothetical protein
LSPACPIAIPEDQRTYCSRLHETVGQTQHHPGPATLAAEQQEQAQELPDQATAQDANEDTGLGEGQVTLRFLEIILSSTVSFIHKQEGQ